MYGQGGHRSSLVFSANPLAPTIREIAQGCYALVDSTRAMQRRILIIGFYAFNNLG